MNSRERMLAAINCEEVDRIPFWPKIFPKYLMAQKGTKYEGWTMEQLHDFIGSDYHEYAAPPISGDDSGGSIREVVKDDHNETIIYTCESGSCRVISDDDHPIEYGLKTKEDIICMTKWYSGTKYKVNEEVLGHQTYQQGNLGEKGILTMPMGRSPFMEVLEFLGGIAETQYMLMDYEKEMEELLEAMHGDLVRRLHCILKYSTADLMYMIEDTSTTYMSPTQFKKYCRPYLMEYNEICLSYGKKLGLHMCGHLDDLLDDLSIMNIAVFEAFTTPPIGNTHLIDGKEKCPNTCLLGGTNAVLWTKSPDEICRGIKSELDAMENHRGIVITSGGVIPPECSPETLKVVCEFVALYPAKN